MTFIPQNPNGLANSANSAPNVAAYDSPEVSSISQMVDLLTNILVELRVLSALIQSGLNVKDISDNIRAEIFSDLTITNKTII